MNIIDFAKRACNEIAEILKKEVKYQEINKLNGTKHYGLTFLEPGGNIAPTIYLEEFYQMYLDTGNWHKTINQIIKVYLSNSFPKCIDMGWFKDFDKVQGLIFHKLINFDTNTTLLENVPYTRYLDFAIVYYAHYEVEKIGNGSILIHNSHLEMWQCTTQKLAELAEENTPRIYPLSISTIQNTIMDLGYPMDDEIFPNIPMYVMSNETKTNGAICIRYKDSLKNFANKLNSDVIILPSSVHEVLLLPLEKDQNFREIRNMVYEVNHDHIPKEDFLSNNIYLYRRDTDNIEIV